MGEVIYVDFAARSSRGALSQMSREQAIMVEILERELENEDFDSWSMAVLCPEHYAKSDTVIQDLVDRYFEMA